MADADADADATQQQRLEEAAAALAAAFGSQHTSPSTCAALRDLLPGASFLRWVAGWWGCGVGRSGAGMRGGTDPCGGP